MASESENDLRLEIGHVLFIDIFGYSKLILLDYANVSWEDVLPKARAAAEKALALDMHIIFWRYPFFRRGASAIKPSRR